jgi:hypothetical protein
MLLNRGAQQVISKPRDSMRKLCLVGQVRKAKKNRALLCTDRNCSMHVVIDSRSSRKTWTANRQSHSWLVNEGVDLNLNRLGSCSTTPGAERP